MFVIICFDVHPGPSPPHRLRVALKINTAFMVYLASHASVLLWKSLTTHYSYIVDLLFDSSGRMRQGRDDRDIALSELSYTDE